MSRTDWMLVWCQLKGSPIWHCTCNNIRMGIVSWTPISESGIQSAYLHGYSNEPLGSGGEVELQGTCAVTPDDRQMDSTAWSHFPAGLHFCPSGRASLGVRVKGLGCQWTGGVLPPRPFYPAWSPCSFLPL